MSVNLQKGIVIAECDGVIRHDGTPTTVRVLNSRRMLRVGCTFVTFEAAKKLTDILAEYMGAGKDVTIQHGRLQEADVQP